MAKASATALARARKLDFEFLYQIAYDPNTPEYNGFNTRVDCGSGCSPIPKSAVRYLPLINMRPADPRAVSTALAQGIKILKDANQDYLVITADQLVFKVIVDFLFDNPAMLQQVVPVLWHMHFLMDFVGAVGSL